MGKGRSGTGGGTDGWRVIHPLGIDFPLFPSIKKKKEQESTAMLAAR